MVNKLFDFMKGRFKCASPTILAAGSEHMVQSPQEGDIRPSSVHRNLAMPTEAMVH